jgi:predicted TIM-barrel fold metal-dependent hydrolase
VPIVDSHSHLGPCRVFDLDHLEDDLVAQMNQYEVDANLVQPFPGAPSAAAVHDRVAALATQHPKRIFGIASINPHQDRDAYFAELSRCVTDLGFVGVKMHTIGHAMNPGGADGTTVFESAKQLGIPVMVHTGPGIPFAAPTSLVVQLKRFPEVPVVMAHGGYSIFAGEAIAVASMFPQVSMEISGSGLINVRSMVNTLGANRVMYGSDLIANVPVMLTLVRSIGLSADDEAMVLGGTAKEIFGLDV